MWQKIKKILDHREEKTDMLLVGLGNPGNKYIDTAHNLGFRVLSLILEEEGLPSPRKDNTLLSLRTEGVMGEKRVVLLFPLTYMNRSGDAVKRAMERFRPQELAVIHDDTDLSWGRMRISISRGSAGHRGVQSIIDHLKSKDFVRFRIGARKEDAQAREVVLRKLSSREIEKRAAKEIKKAISEEIAPCTIDLQ